MADEEDSTLSPLYNTLRRLREPREGRKPHWFFTEKLSQWANNTANAIAAQTSGATGDDGRKYPLLGSPWGSRDQDDDREKVPVSSDETPLARRRSRLSRMRRGRFERPTNPLVAPCVPDSAWADAWQAEPTRNADNSNEPIAPGVREGGKKLWCEYSAPTATGLFEGGEQQDGELPWACLGEKQQPFFNPAVIDTRSSGPNPQHHPPNPSDFSRQILTAVDIASVAACAVMTATMLNFSQDPGRTCPSPSADPRWAAALPLVPQLPEVLRCPDPTTYVLALSVYSVVGMVQVALEPKYWADCGLVAALAALGAGGAYGPRCMVDVLILGGFLSLVCSKVLGWYGNNRRGERAAGRN